QWPKSDSIYPSLVAVNITRRRFSADCPFGGSSRFSYNPHIAKFRVLPTCYMPPIFSTYTGIVGFQDAVTLLKFSAQATISSDELANRGRISLRNP
ncbi:MAG TPA: hypothetical protein PKI05_13110, partial [Thermogutta sp.]|nr:hypothetical protein [Thermogutta sp.]